MQRNCVLENKRQEINAKTVVRVTVYRQLWITTCSSLAAWHTIGVNFAFYVLSPKSAVKSAGESDVYSLQLRFLWLEVKFFYDVCLLSLSELLFHALFHKCLFSSSWLLPHSATQQRHIDEIIILLLIIYSLTKWFRQDMNNYVCMCIFRTYFAMDWRLGKAMHGRFYAH